MGIDERLEQTMSDVGILVVDRAVEGYKGLLVRKDGLSYVFVDPKATRRARAAILAEEFGHYKTSVGDTVRGSDDIRIRRAEERAMRAAVDMLVCPEDVIQAIKSGVRNWYELSEELDLPESFLQKAVEVWKKQYGPVYCTDENGDVLWLEPLSLHVFDSEI
ncbi:MAG: hypothetical protein WCG21_11715 [Eubacteriales bacterium]